MSLRPALPSILRFGSATRELVGVLHVPARTATRPGAVLLCGPMGQEAIRSHRLFTVLANRLARDGFTVLHFDYYGTGDSGGDDLEGDLQGWRRDLLAADEVLRRSSSHGAVLWFGLRLGAALALDASRTAARAPDAIALCDAVVDGAAYLRELAHVDRQAQLRAFSMTPANGKRIRQLAVPDVPSEVLGFELSGELRSQLAGLSPGSLDGFVTAHLRVLDTGAPHDLTPIVESARRRAIPVAHDHVVSAIDWATNDGVGSSIVSNDIVAAVLRAANEVRQ